MTQPGRATADGTRRFATRRQAAAGHFRQAGDWTLSSIGLGTYLGAVDAATDAGYTAAAGRALRLACNVLDSAVNYRGQRSERTVGRALAAAVEAGDVSRDEVVVATKGGFLTHDAERPGGAGEQLEAELLRPGIITADDVVAGCHCMTPAYLRHQLGRSLANLGVATVDVYYVHNPETQLQELTATEFDRRIRAAFAALEEEVAAGRVGVYGTATWSGYREPPGQPGHLSLAALRRAAEDVAGPGRDHFRVLQLPVNLAMTEALLVDSQNWKGRTVPLLAAAEEAGMTVMASGSLLQAQLTRGLPAEVRAALGGDLSDAQRALQFARSAPGVTTALVGMSRPAHVEENLALSALPPLGRDWYAAAG